MDEEWKEVVRCALKRCWEHTVAEMSFCKAIRKMCAVRVSNQNAFSGLENVAQGLISTHQKCI